MTDTAKPTEGGYMVYTPTLRERFWRKLGFRYHLGEEPEGPELQGWMQTVAGLRLSFTDRLRILLTGHLRIKLTMSIDTPSPATVKTRMDWEIRAPGDHR